MVEQKLPTGLLMRAFDRYSQALRNERPTFIRFKDGKLIKHALQYLTEFQMEMLFVWFLKIKKEMRPAIGAALCKEVISDFLEASRREYGFYNQLEQQMRRLTGGSTVRIQGEAKNISAALEKFWQSIN